MMKYELMTPLYLLFARLANYEDDVDESLDNFLKDNIDLENGIDRKVVFDTLERAFLKSEALNVRIDDEVTIRNALSWIRENREEEKIAKSMTYEELFKNPEDCTRITSIILEKGCTDGIFTGFGDISGTPKNQLLIVYDIVKKRFLNPAFTDTKGNREIAKCKFFERFGWFGFRDSKQKEGRRSINLKKSTMIYDTKPNSAAKIDLQLLLR